MSHRTRWPALFLVLSAIVFVSLSSQAVSETNVCDGPDRPPDPNQTIDRTRLAHLTDTVGSYGFDLAGPVYALAIASGDARILAGGASRTAILWHPKAGRAMRESEIADRDVTAVGFSPDYRYGLLGLGLSGSEGYPIYVWDLISGYVVKTLAGHSWDVTAVMYSHDGARILSASRDGLVKIWDAQTGQELLSLTHPWQVLAATFSPDDREILSASRDGQLFLWNAENGERIRTFDGLRGPVRTVAFSADGARVLAASDAGIAQEWDAASGKTTRVLRLELGSTHDPALLRPLTDAAPPSLSPLPVHLMISPGGEHLAVASSDGLLTTWNLNTLQLEDSGRAPVHAERSGGRVAISSDGRYAVEGFANGRVRLRDLINHRDLPTGRQVEGGLDKLITSADGSRLFGLNATTHRLMLLDGELNTVRVYDGPGEGFFDPSGKIALASIIRPKTGRASLHVIDATTGKNLRQLIGGVYLEAFAFSRDAKRAVALYTLDPPGDASNSYLRVWDLRRGHKVKELDLPYAGETMFTSDMRYALTSTADNGLLLWDLANGKVRHTISPRTDVHQRPLAMSLDGKLLATTGNDRLIRLWDVQTGDLLRQLKGHRCLVTGAAFTPDGRRLLSIGGDDEELRLWDGATAEQVDALDLMAYGDHPVSAVFSNDGQSFLVGTRRGILLRYDFDSAGATANADSLPDNNL